MWRWWLAFFFPLFLCVLAGTFLFLLPSSPSVVAKNVADQGDRGRERAVNLILSVSGSKELGLPQGRMAGFPMPLLFLKPFFFFPFT